MKRSSAYAAGVSEAVAHCFVDDLGDEVTIDGDDGHHLARVRRHGPGARLTISDGSGHWRLYEITREVSSTLRCRAVSGPVAEPDPSPRLTMAPALSKVGLEDVAARLTELGVSRLAPVVTARTIVRWDDDRTARAVARLERVTREAAVQSRRSRLVVIDEPRSLHEIAGRSGCILASRDGDSVASVRARMADAEVWTVLSGPEGGFAAEELEALAHVPRLGLGPHVLRANTAPLAAAAVLQGEMGAFEP